MVKISKKTNLVRYIVEESYLFEAVNKTGRALNQIKFRLKPDAYKHLKIITISDSNNQINMQSTVTTNNFKVKFNHPIEPEQTFHFRVIIYLYNCLVFKP